MKILAEPLPQLLLIEPTVFADSRGYFMETFHSERARSIGINDSFVQDNESHSQMGVLRGLHYQVGAHAQSKWVRVVTGSVWDVAVDLRKDSPTYGQHFGTLLSAKNKLQMYIPRGFAHGFLVMEDHSIFCYKCDNFYSRDAEAGLKYNDSQLDIPWPEIEQEYIISEKDQRWPHWTKNIAIEVPYE
jgi:dTDP-4-dehydrorhamnose 3,5-epimerase